MDNQLHNKKYRKAVCIMLLNRQKKIFIAQRKDCLHEAWQMPQGGIDVGEAGLEAALRELREETSIKSISVEFLAESAESLCYTFPKNSNLSAIAKKEFCGQELKCFLFQFIGLDEEISLQTQTPEFSTWRWIDSAELLDFTVSFKYEVYRKFLEDFQQEIAL